MRKRRRNKRAKQPQPKTEIEWILYLKEVWHKIDLDAKDYLKLEIAILKANRALIDNPNWTKLEDDLIVYRSVVA